VSGRRRQLCRYLLEGAAFGGLDTCGVVGLHQLGMVALRPKMVDAGAAAPDGGWCVEAAASNGLATTGAWGVVVVQQGMGGVLVLRG
jgi:hypothetical protein